MKVSLKSLSPGCSTIVLSGTYTEVNRTCRRQFQRVLKGECAARKIGFTFTGDSKGIDVFERFYFESNSENRDAIRQIAIQVAQQLNCEFEEAN